jgi:hypothetical protein
MAGLFSFSIFCDSLIEAGRKINKLNGIYCSQFQILIVKKFNEICRIAGASKSLQADEPEPDPESRLVDILKFLILLTAGSNILAVNF